MYSSKKEFQMTSRYIKKCLASLAIKKVKIKTTLGFHLTPVRWPYSRAITTTNAGEDASKPEPLYRTS
jgi:hypothetical protein